MELSVIPAACIGHYFLMSVLKLWHSPSIRDKLVLNITDGLRAQYDGGPMPNAEFTYDYNTIFMGTDPFALDLVCHNILLEKRKSMKIEVNEHPMFTEYLRYAEKLGLGLVDPEKTEHVSLDLSA